MIMLVEIVAVVQFGSQRYVIPFPFSHPVMQQIEFLQAVMPWLDSRNYVFRYSWFCSSPGYTIMVIPLRWAMPLLMRVIELVLSRVMIGDIHWHELSSSLFLFLKVFERLGRSSTSYLSIFSHRVQSILIHNLILMIKNVWYIGIIFTSDPKCDLRSPRISGTF